MKTTDQKTSVMVKIGRSELDKPREVVFTNEHFNTYDFESELLESCFTVSIVLVPEIKDIYYPQIILQPAYPYLPDERRQMLKKLGKPSLALSPPDSIKKTEGCLVASNAVKRKNNFFLFFNAIPHENKNYQNRKVQSPVPDTQSVL